MIELKRLFMGVESNERPIHRGIYEENDPRLFGLATYLVENGHAIALHSVAVEPAPTPEPIDPDVEFNRKLLGDRITVQDGKLVATVAEPVKPTPDPDKALAEIESELAADDLKALRERYAELAGKKAFNGWSAEQLAEKIKALEDAEGDNEGF